MIDQNSPDGSLPTIKPGPTPSLPPSSPSSGSSDLQRLKDLIAQGYYPTGFTASAQSNSETMTVTLVKEGSSVGSQPTATVSSSQPDFIQYAVALQKAIESGQKI